MTIHASRRGLAHVVLMQLAAPRLAEEPWWRVVGLPRTVPAEIRSAASQLLTPEPQRGEGVLDVIASFPQEHRRVLLLRAEGLSTVEIAARLRIPVRAAERCVARAVAYASPLQESEWANQECEWKRDKAKWAAWQQILAYVSRIQS